MTNLELREQQLHVDSVNTRCTIHQSQDHWKYYRTYKIECKYFFCCERSHIKSWWCGVNVSQATAIGQLQAGAIKVRANWRAPSTTRFWRVLIFHVFIPELGPMTVFVNEAMKILVYFPNLCQHVLTQQCATSAIFWHILLDIHNFSAID